MPDLSFTFAECGLDRIGKDVTIIRIGSARNARKMNEVTAFVLLGVIMAVIIVVLVIICIRSTKKQKEAQTEKALQYDRENDFFTKSGYVISKRIKNLIIDNEHEKWMVAGADKIFNYSDVIDISISENGSQLEVGVLSVHTTIKSLSNEQRVNTIAEAQY